MQSGEMNCYEVNTNTRKLNDTDLYELLSFQNCFANFSQDIALNVPPGVKSWYEIENLINLQINRKEKFATHNDFTAVLNVNLIWIPIKTVLHSDKQTASRRVFSGRAQQQVERWAFEWSHTYSEGVKPP